MTFLYRPQVPSDMTKVKQPMRLTAELVARVHRVIEDPGPVPGMAQVPDAYFDTITQDILAKIPTGGSVWIFAFGSLIWKPKFEFVERRIGLVRGWHRAFCLGWDRRYRGNKDQPGLMLSLDRGGQCVGVAFRLPTESAEANLANLLRKEPPFPPRWVNVATDEGPIRAIAFVCPRNSPAFIGGLSMEETAEKLAVAVGYLGSMAEYIHNTVTHLEVLGIHDRHLWRMQELVAERIDAG